MYGAEGVRAEARIEEGIALGRLLLTDNDVDRSNGERAQNQNHQNKPPAQYAAGFVGLVDGRVRWRDIVNAGAGFSHARATRVDGAERSEDLPNPAATHAANARERSGKWRRCDVILRPAVRSMTEDGKDGHAAGV